MDSGCSKQGSRSMEPSKALSDEEAIRAEFDAAIKAKKPKTVEEYLIIAGQFWFPPNKGEDNDQSD